MTVLNEKNKITEKVIHIMVTSLCDRNCKHCCNNQYDLNDIPYVTDEELRNAETICLTGGEPFLFSNPCMIAHYYKTKYKNIKNIYVYTNAVELALYLRYVGKIDNIDGLSISIKTSKDAEAFKCFIEDREDIKILKSNLLYVFDDLYTENSKGFTVIKRKWQKDFHPANDSIFRRI